jgi:hypothetical protein
MYREASGHAVYKIGAGGLRPLLIVKQCRKYTLQVALPNWMNNLLNFKIPGERACDRIGYVD